MPAVRLYFSMINRAIVLLIGLSVCSSINAGVMVGGSRFVFNENSKVLSVMIRNPDASNYLIKARILPPTLWEKEGAVVAAADSLIITPPLFRLDAGRENIIRIVRGPTSLPEDRESLFEFSVAAIPSVKGESNSVALAVRSRFKLFYRPQNLPGDAKTAWSSLRWYQRGNTLIARNTSPWFVTLATVNIDNTAIADPGMLAPFGEREYEGCHNNKLCQVRWQALDDNGQFTAFTGVTLSH